MRNSNGSKLPRKGQYNRSRHSMRGTLHQSADSDRSTTSSFRSIPPNQFDQTSLKVPQTPTDLSLLLNIPKTNWWRSVYLKILLILDCIFLITAVSNSFISNTNIIDTLIASYLNNPCYYLSESSQDDSSSPIYSHLGENITNPSSYLPGNDIRINNLPYQPSTIPNSVKEEIDFICISSWITLLIIGFLVLMYTRNLSFNEDFPAVNSSSNYNLSNIPRQSFIPTIVLSESLRLYNLYRIYELMKIVSISFMIFYYLNFVSQATFRIRRAISCHLIISNQRQMECNIYGIDNWWSLEELTFSATNIWSTTQSLLQFNDLWTEIFLSIFADIEIYMSLIWISGHLIAVYMCNNMTRRIHSVLENIKSQSQVFL